MPLKKNGPNFNITINFTQEIPLKMNRIKKKLTKKWNRLHFYKGNPFKNESDKKKRFTKELKTPSILKEKSQWKNVPSILDEKSLFFFFIWNIRKLNLLQRLTIQPLGSQYHRGQHLDNIFGHKLDQILHPLRGAFNQQY